MDCVYDLNEIKDDGENDNDNGDDVVCSGNEQDRDR